jgi:hypothetical protein
MTVSLHAQYSWTIPSGAWTHRRTLFSGEPEELVRVFHRERLRQEELEKTGYCSPKWTVLRSLQQVYGARKVRVYTILDTPPFFESGGREESEDPMNRDKRVRGLCQIKKRETHLSFGETIRDRLSWSGTSCFRVNRRMQRRSSPTKMTGLSGGSNPLEVSGESDWERISNPR